MPGMTHDTIAEFGAGYCVIDIHSLFVCATLEDEILVLGAGDALFADLKTDALSFGFVPDRGRRLDSYSGGEQAILCCLLLMRLLPRDPLQIMLVRVLETLSPKNRELLLLKFATMLPAATLFTLTPSGPRAIHA
ncbi:MAG: hypothetical protein GXY42_03690 [Desulfovibrionales bacterium]|nr:hypothetical protein [Desulfovibrionales bacterium]